MNRRSAPHTKQYARTRSKPSSPRTSHVLDMRTRAASPDRLSDETETKSDVYITVENENSLITSPRQQRRKSGNRLLPSPHNKRPSNTTSNDEVSLTDFQFPFKELVNGTFHGVTFTARYAFDVLSTAVRYLRFPITVLVFIWLLALIIGRVERIMSPAFSPLCILPGISSSSFCNFDRRPSRTLGDTVWADYPNLVNVQSKTFEQLMDNDIGKSTLSLEIKKAEMATSDLITLVRVSNLKSKDLLAGSLRDFVSDAKKTSRGLQKMSSKIGGVVDNIMAVNDYALRSIEEAKAASGLSISTLLRWSLSSERPVRDVVTKTFEEAMNVLNTEMKRLILEAEINLENLIGLEEHLNTLHEIVAREDNSISLEKNELLAELWTKLGGNGQRLRSFDKNLYLLKNLGAYRKQALAHVVAALHTLQKLSEDMEDMRERVASPILTGDEIPVQVQIKSIQLGIERLRYGRIKANKLEENAIRRVLGIE